MTHFWPPGGQNDPFWLIFGPLFLTTFWPFFTIFVVLSLLVLRVGVSKNGSKMGRKWVDFGNFSSEPTAWLRDLRKMAISKSVKNHLFWSFCGFKPTDFERVHLKNGHFGTPSKSNFLQKCGLFYVIFFEKNTKKSQKSQKCHFFDFFLWQFGDRSHYWNNAEKLRVFVDGGFRAGRPRVA